MIYIVNVICCTRIYLSILVDMYPYRCIPRVSLPVLYTCRDTRVLHVYLYTCTTRVEIHVFYTYISTRVQHVYLYTCCTRVNKGYIIAAQSIRTLHVYYACNSTRRIHVQRYTCSTRVMYGYTRGTPIIREIHVYYTCISTPVLTGLARVNLCLIFRTLYSTLLFPILYLSPLYWRRIQHFQAFPRPS